MKYLIMTLVMGLLPFTVFSGDLDDGIKKDSAISATGNELAVKQNYSYLTANINARIARSKAGDESIKVIDGCGGTGNINIIGAKNSKIRTVINNSNNTGSTTNCQK